MISLAKFFSAAVKRSNLTVAVPIAFAVGTILCVTILWSGDGRSSIQTNLYLIQGFVLVNGEAAENVNIAFHPVKSDSHVLCPVGRTNSSGAFTLTTGIGYEGALAGEYNVTFIWPDPTVEYDECECPDPLIHDRFKGLYASAEQSGYQASVSATSTSFTFSLWRPRSNDRLP